MAISASRAKTNANLIPAKKGECRNPGGRRKTPPDLLKARTINTFELERVVNKYLYSTEDELKEAEKHPETHMLDRMIISIMQKAVRAGDQGRLDFVLCRMLGKVKDKLEITESIEKKSLHVSMTMKTPTPEELALDNPNLTMAQLEAFSEKIGKIKQGLLEGSTFPSVDKDDGEDGATIDVETAETSGGKSD